MTTVVVGAATAVYDIIPAFPLPSFLKRAPQPDTEDQNAENGAMLGEEGVHTEAAGETKEIPRAPRKDAKQAALARFEKSQLDDANAMLRDSKRVRVPNCHNATPNDFNLQMGVLLAQQLSSMDGSLRDAHQASAQNAARIESMKARRMEEFTVSGSRTCFFCVLLFFRE